MEEKNLMPDYESNFSVLVDYITQYKNEGYNIYSDISEIKKLIDFIVNWYEIKYPDNIIEMSKEAYISVRKSVLYMIMPIHETRRTESLSKYMDYYQLMLRLPESMHRILECWYKGNDHDGNSKFGTSIGLKDSLVEHNIPIDASVYYGELDITKSILLDKYMKITCSSIDELVDENNLSKNVDYTEIDFSDPIKVVKTHNIDLEIRNKILNIIILKLFQTSSSKINGYIRAKQFIDEFNKYIYNLNLSSDIIDSYIKEMFDESFDIQTVENNNDEYIIENIELNEVIQYVIKDITTDNSKNKPVDEYGLTFKTLRTLKNDNIHNINNLLPGKNNVSSMDIDIRERYYYISSKDKSILRKMREEAMANLSYQITINSLKEKKEEITKIEEPKQKRKSIFGRNKQK
jgi:hypothetical protein